MYCRTCGNLIESDHKICRNCGSFTSIRNEKEEEEIVFNQAKEEDKPLKKPEGFKVFDNASSQRNLEKEQPLRKDFEVKGGDETEYRFERLDIKWNTDDFNRPKKKTEEIEIKWKVDAPEEDGDPVSDVKIYDKKDFANEIEDNIKEETGEAADISSLNHTLMENKTEMNRHVSDQFFTFSEQKKEFQKHLDAELEQLNRSKDTSRDWNIAVPKIDFAGILPEPPESIDDLLKVPSETEVNEPVGGLAPEETKEIVEIDISDAEAEGVLISEEGLGAGSAGTAFEAEAEEEIGYIEKIIEELPATEEVEEESMEFSDETEPKVDAPVEIGRSSSRPEKKGTVSKAILLILLIVFVLQLTSLGIRYFLPDTEAAQYLNELHGKAASAIMNLFSSETEPEQVPDSIPETDPVKEEDGMDAVIASQLHLNANIGRVAYNENLAWDSETSYISENITNSRPIEENLWYTDENGTDFFYDQSLVGALIAFDSQWIDYVNDGDPSVLERTVMGSAAYKNAVNYKGHMAKKFLTLEIGEMRRGNEYFYVWAHEKLENIENNTVTPVEYNWVYQLQPVDGDMKIVNYFSIK